MKIVRHEVSEMARSEEEQRKGVLKVSELIIDLLKLNDVNPADAVCGMLTVIANQCLYCGFSKEKFKDLLDDVVKQYQEK